MLWYLCTKRKRLPLDQLGEFAGDRFRRLVRPLYYESIPRRSALPGGAYVFSDLDILDPQPLVRLRTIAERIEEHGGIMLNDPRRALARYALLRRLHVDGINDFDVMRVDEARVPARWPVFLRGERDHHGGGPDLLPDAAALAAALGRDPTKDLIVEYLDMRDADGYVRKYSACRVGDRVFARHLLFDRDWMVKLADEAGDEQLAEERHFEAEFPDRKEIESIFRSANIEYGRIDYGRRDGRIQVWEINTNPSITSMKRRWEWNKTVIQRHADAMMAEAERARGRSAIPLDGIRWIRPRWWRKPI